MTVYTWLLEICSTNAFGDFNVAFCTSIFVFQCCMEYGKKPVLTALAEGLTIRKYLDKFPDKYPINRTNQTIFQTSYYYNYFTWYTKCDNAECMRGHAVLSLEQLAGISCKALENVLCPAVIMSPEPKWHIFILVMIMWFAKLPN